MVFPVHFESILVYWPFIAKFPYFTFQNIRPGVKYVGFQRKKRASQGNYSSSENMYTGLEMTDGISSPLYHKSLVRSPVLASYTAK